MPIMPASSVFAAFDDVATPLNMAFILESPAKSFVIDRDGLRIGSSPVCEFPLAGGPALHSVIHLQSGVTWIESQEDASLIINGHPRRRMALRDGDVLELNGLELIVRLHSIAEMEEKPHGLVDDLSLLSAEELCDRILSEQAMVDEFSEGQRSGWNNLFAAIEAAHESEQPEVTQSIEVAQTMEAAAPDNCERLLEQIRELSEMVNGRSQELDDCESELVAATALLEEAQERVSQQIEGLLEQLQTPSGEMELRASA